MNGLSDAVDSRIGLVGGLMAFFNIFSEAGIITTSRNTD
jgi:hypothetical protein